MCGIAGVLDRLASTTAEELKSLVETMTACVAHRGPDDEGSWIDPRAGIALGHRRLAVIDLSHEGHQPMSSADGRWTVTYNGELYNYVEIRRELEGAGAAFRGRSDTEVLVEAIATWGLETLLGAANGMFAFAAWDAAERRLHLVRDRLGEKPLLFAEAGRHLVFGSELPALRRHPSFVGEIDRDRLADYFRLTYVPGDLSIYRGVRKVAPGCVATFGEGVAVGGVVHRYWDPEAVAASPAIVVSDDDAVDEMEALLLDSARLRSRADVPLGTFLSGGIDSSLVTAMLQAATGRPAHTFTAGFEARSHDESAPAAAVARHLGSVHHHLPIGEALALATVPRLAAVFDEPFGDPSALPTLLVAEAARAHVTVALTGDGGDELFTGYNRHVLGERLWQGMRRTPAWARRAAGRGLLALPHGPVDRTLATVAAGRIRSPADKLHRLGRVVGASTVDDLYARLASTWWPESPVVGVSAPVAPGLRLDLALGTAARMSFSDAVTTLPDQMFVKVDRASMAVALEVRPPLVDHRVAEWVWTRRPDLRLRGGEGKWLLRRVLERHVPNALTDRPKMGFDPPIDAWLRGPLRSWAEELLAPARLRASGYLDPDPIERRWHRHLSGRRNHDYELWTVLMFEAWREEHGH